MAGREHSLEAWEANKPEGSGTMTSKEYDRMVLGRSTQKAERITKKTEHNHLASKTYSSATNSSRLLN